MRLVQRLIAVSAVAGLPFFVGCTSSGDSDYRGSSRSYDPSYRSTRSYDPSYDRYDRAGTAGYDYGSSSGRVWRDSDGNLHHPPGWKAASDRGRDDNDRDDPSRNGGSDYRYDRSYDRY